MSPPATPTTRRSLAAALLVAAAVLGPARAAADIAGKLVFVPLPPCRVLDTRFAAAGVLASGETRAFEIAGTSGFETQGGTPGGCAVPAGGVTPIATAVAINFIAVNPSGPGHLTAWAFGDAAPNASVLNYASVGGLNIANGVVVPIDGGAGLDLNLFAAAATHVVADVAGYFTPLSLHDGPGSGLDADTVGGLSAAQLAPQGFDPTAAPAGNTVAAADDPASAVVGQHTSIAIGVDGLPVISHYDATNGNLLVTHCDDRACAGGSEPTSVVDGSANDVGQYSSIAIGSDGLPVVSYYDNTAKALKVARCDDVACAGGGEQTSTVEDHGSDDLGSFGAIAIGADGLPVISYRRGTSAPSSELRLVHCNDLACAPGGEIFRVVDAPAGIFVGYYTAIAIGADGLPIVAYYETSGGNLRLAHCGDLTCTTATVSIPDAAAPDHGKYAAITIGDDRLPIVSYINASFGYVMVMHCNDLLCAGQNETITQVASANTNDPSAADTAISIGRDGLPLVAFRTEHLTIEPTLALRLAQCTREDCSGPSVVTTLENTASDLGEHLSMAIGRDGLPIVSSFDDTADSLRVVHCGNAMCVPYLRRR